uniref:adult enhancer factor 1-like isoform X2 n=1 Tax=Scatophagus argus TaxID=75038 RepID=UPI001ED854E7|nr:adult enhancer factor 1-like isoform X2 [Scatophagus argus]
MIPKQVNTLLSDQQGATAVRLRAAPLATETTETVPNKEVTNGTNRDVLFCQSSIRADMSSLQHLNEFISERLTAAAVEIFGAVEKTLIEYQGEINRSKQEIDHLRTLVLWPQVRLHRSASRQFSPPCWDKEASPERSHAEKWAPDVSPDHPGTLCVKEEHDQRAVWRGPSCGQQKARGDPMLPSQLYRIVTVEQAADIKAEPYSEEFITSPSTRKPEIPFGINPKSSGLQQETQIDRPEVTDEQQDGSPLQHHKDPDPLQVKVEKLTSSSAQKERHNNEPPPQSERSVYNQRHSSSPSHDHILTNQTFDLAEKNRQAAEGDSDQPSRVTTVSHPLHCVNQSQYGTESVVNGEWIKAPKKRQNSNLCSEGGNSIGVGEDVNDLIRERKHTCPVCAKRFKESSHLKDHVRIHTGEKPYRCKECGMNFRQSGTLTLHMRIHTGERPHQCTDCGRRFNRKGDMETHRVTHTGERPHLCTMCGKSFKRKSNLNTHVKIHAEDKMNHTQPL